MPINPPENNNKNRRFWKNFKIKRPAITSCFKYLTVRFFLLILVHTILTNPYIDSFIYGNLKELLHKHLKSGSSKNNHFCSLKNLVYVTPVVNENICTTCEVISKIPKIYGTSFYEIETTTMRQGVSVIVADAMLEWTSLYDTTLNNFTEISKSAQMRDYEPCYILTNINHRSSYISDYLEIISNPFARRWFLTWKNCDLPGAKIFRHFYQQPYFLKYFWPASSVNWVILSYRYMSSNLKEIRTQGGKLLMVMQLRGSLHFELKPIERCLNLCKSIKETLSESEILILNTELWQLDYSAQTEDTSITIITENESVS